MLREHSGERIRTVPELPLSKLNLSRRMCANWKEEAQPTVSNHTPLPVAQVANCLVCSVGPMGFTASGGGREVVLVSLRYPFMVLLHFRSSFRQSFLHPRPVRVTPALFPSAPCQCSPLPAITSIHSAGTSTHFRHPNAIPWRALVK